METDPVPTITMTKVRAITNQLSLAWRTVDVGLLQIEETPFRQQANKPPSVQPPWRQPRSEEPSVTSVTTVQLQPIEPVKRMEPVVGAKYCHLIITWSNGMLLELSLPLLLGRNSHLAT